MIAASPENLLAGVLMAALLLYALGAGADFGGGVLDLFARGPRGERERKVIAHALGPIWEANHVWLVLVVVLLFVGFPLAFSALMVALHVPVSLMLVGIVLRGAAFTFRTYDAHDDAVQRRWSRVFAAGSVLAPVMLGVCVGAVVGGRLRVDIETGDVLWPRAGEGVSPYTGAWLTPFPFAVGLLTLALCAFLAAVYLVHETPEPDLRAAFRRRARGALIAVTLLAWAALLLAREGAPRLALALLRSPWALGLQAATALTGVAAFVALAARRDGWARALGIAMTALLVAGWGAAQYPLLIVPDVSLHMAAAPPQVLRLMLWTLAGGAVLLFPALFYLFAVFKGPHPAPKP